MNDEERVSELAKWAAGQIEELVHLARRYPPFPDYVIERKYSEVAKQILSHPDLALIDREKERPKFYPRGTTGVNPILPVQVNIPKVIKDLYDSYQPVIPIAKALKEIEDGH